MQKTPNEYWSIQELAQLANSPAGKDLIKLIRSQGSNHLYQAAKKAADGDSHEFEQAIRNLLSTPEAEAILNQIGRQ